MEHLRQWWQDRGSLLNETHRERSRQFAKEMEVLFTDHPHETGETYWQHLGFTARMSLRIVTCGTILFIHGLLPFTFRHTVSARIEAIYTILKARIPKNRRDAIDANWEI